ASLNVGELEQIFVQSRFQLDIAADHAQPLFELRVEPGLIQYPVRPKQNRIERRAQFVTEGSEKTILGGTGRFGILFCPLQFLLDPSTLNKKPNITRSEEHTSELQSPDHL